MDIESDCVSMRTQKHIKEENMEDFECLTKCEKTEFTGKLDPTKEPPSFVTEDTEETEEVQS